MTDRCGGLLRLLVQAALRGDVDSLFGVQPDGIVDGPAWILLLGVKDTIAKDVAAKKKQLEDGLAKLKYPEKITYTVQGTFYATLGAGGNAGGFCTEDTNWLQSSMEFGYTTTIDIADNPVPQTTRFAAFMAQAHVGSKLALSCSRDLLKDEDTLTMRIYLTGGDSFFGVSPEGMGAGIAAYAASQRDEEVVAQEKACVLLSLSLSA